MTPRPLSALVTLKGTSFTMWYKLDTGLCVRVIRCALHLDSLYIRPAVADQVARLLRSSCSSTASVGDFMDLKALGVISKGSDMARFKRIRERVRI